MRYEYLTVIRTTRLAGEVAALTDLLNEYAKDGWWLFAIYKESHCTEKIVFERVQERMQSGKEEDHARLH
jgi:hypothetical protein